MAIAASYLSVTAAILSSRRLWVAEDSCVASWSSSWRILARIARCSSLREARPAPHSRVLSHPRSIYLSVAYRGYNTRPKVLGRGHRGVKCCWNDALFVRLEPSPPHLFSGEGNYACTAGSRNCTHTHTPLSSIYLTTSEPRFPPPPFPPHTSTLIPLWDVYAH